MSDRRLLSREGVEGLGPRGGGALETGGGHFPGAGFDFIGGFVFRDGGAVRGGGIQRDEGENQVGEEEDTDGGGPIGV